ncbi:MAG: glycosyltransferase, partial [Burkholderiaceae bacterium]
QRARLQAAHPDVHFAGTQRDEALARHYASADLFLFPSLTDTFGNVTLEALASGLAVVAFDTAAAAEHVREGVSGWLAAPEPLRAAAEAAFHDALARAAAPAAWRLDSPVRQAAREAALRADWPRVLQRFEQRLCITADAATTHRFTHAALA